MRLRTVLLVMLVAAPLHAAMEIVLDPGFPTPPTNTVWNNLPIRFKGSVRDSSNPQTVLSGTVKIAFTDSGGFTPVPLVNGTFDFTFAAGVLPAIVLPPSGYTVTLLYYPPNENSYFAFLYVPYVIQRGQHPFTIRVVQPTVVHENEGFTIQVTGADGDPLRGQETVPLFYRLDGKQLPRRFEDYFPQNGMGIPFLGISIGVHHIEMIYPGSSYLVPYTAAMDLAVVPREPTAISKPVMAPPNPGPEDTVTLESSVLTPAARGCCGMYFYDGGMELSGWWYTVNGVSTAKAGPFAPGQHSIVANFYASPAFAPSVSEALTFTVGPYRTALDSLEMVSGSPKVGQSLTFRTSLQPATPVAVALFDGEEQIGQGESDASGNVTLTGVLRSAGSRKLSARFGGNFNYAAAQSPVLTLAVRATPAIRLVSVTNPTSPSSDFALKASVLLPTSDSAAPSGKLTFREGAAVLATVNLDSAGRAEFMVPGGTLSAGEHRIEAAYSGDTFYDSATSNAIVQLLNGGVTQITLSASSKGGKLSLTAKITGGKEPTGSVTFKDLTSAATYQSVVNQGIASFEDANALAGHMLQATYAGDGQNSGSMSSPQLVLALLNGFSYQFADVAPDEVLTIFGSSLAGAPQAATLPLPLALAGSTVSITDLNGQPHLARWYFASPAQATVVIPGDLPPGPAEFVLKNSSGDIVSESIVVASAAPALATSNADGAGVPAAQIQRLKPDGSVQTESAAVFDSATSKWVPSPLVFGGDELYLILYGTGFRHGGGTTCLAQEKSLAVFYAGEQGTYPGLDQINVRLTAQLQGLGMVNVICKAAGATSNTVSLLFP
ncbi:MAG: Ig-like domain repeat protein [Acidobacteriota bacterium]